MCDAAPLSPGPDRDLLGANECCVWQQHVDVIQSSPPALGPMGRHHRLEHLLGVQLQSGLLGPLIGSRDAPVGVSFVLLGVSVGVTF